MKAVTTSELEQVGFNAFSVQKVAEAFKKIGMDQELNFTYAGVAFSMAHANKQSKQDTCPIVMLVRTETGPVGSEVKVGCTRHIGHKDGCNFDLPDTKK